jgi:AraC-like DNA-binding protein
VKITRKLLFESDTLTIGLVETRPLSEACGDVEQQSANTVVLPVSGVFSKHDTPSRSVIGTPSHAVWVAADTPYRISFPGAIGDRAIALRFGDALAPELFDRQGSGEGLAPHGLLPAHAMMLRNLLWTRLKATEANRFEMEALGLDLLEMSLASMRTGRSSTPGSADARRSRAVARVKEAVAVAPADKWTVARLARLANLSPFHLCHVFRQIAGTSIYDYVLHERLAYTLNAVLDGGDDLTAVALDAGFASHSHFTARFRRFFDCTPVALRRMASAGHLGELRKIMTARRNGPVLD